MVGGTTAGATIDVDTTVGATIDADTTVGATTDRATIIDGITIGAHASAFTFISDIGQFNLAVLGFATVDEISVSVRVVRSTLLNGAYRQGRRPAAIRYR